MQIACPRCGVLPTPLNPEATLEEMPWGLRKSFLNHLQKTTCKKCGSNLYLINKKTPPNEVTKLMDGFLKSLTQEERMNIATNIEKKRFECDFEDFKKQFADNKSTGLSNPELDGEEHFKAFVKECGIRGLLDYCCWLTNKKKEFDKPPESNFGLNVRLFLFKTNFSNGSVCHWDSGDVFFGDEIQHKKLIELDGEIHTVGRIQDLEKIILKEIRSKEKAYAEREQIRQEMRGLLKDSDERNTRLEKEKGELLVQLNQLDKEVKHYKELFEKEKTKASKS